MEIELVFKIILGLWYLGVSLSVICLLIQTSLYIMLPASRKLDQKILTQLTIARFLNIIFEYGSIYQIENMVLACLVIMVYFYSDAALVCWMSVFTKRLYDKLVVVFAHEMSFVWLSLIVWLSMVPIGILSFTLMYCHTSYIFKLCYVYCLVKCVIFSINFLVFCRIFRVVITAKRDRDLKGTLRTCINTFLLLSVTSLQVVIRFFYTDNTPLFELTHDDSRNSFLILFGVLNSYQVMAITLIFVMSLSAANKSEQSILTQIVGKFKKNNSLA